MKVVGLLGSTTALNLKQRHKFKLGSCSYINPVIGWMESCIERIVISYFGNAIIYFKISAFFVPQIFTVFNTNIST